MKKSVAIGLTLLTLVGASCGYQRTEATNWGCSFGEGPFDSRDLKGTLEPGERGSLSNDKVVSIPADVRTYVLDEDQAVRDYNAFPLELIAQGRDLDLDAGGGDAEVVARLAQSTGVVPVQVELQAKFKINERACALYVGNLRSYDQGEFGLNFNAGQGESSGWSEFLNLSWNQKMVEAARPVVFDRDWLTLNTNGVVQIEGERGNVFEILNGLISENLSRELRKDLGGDYFCGPGYTFDGKIDGEIESCPPIEITVKEIKPIGDKGAQLMSDYQSIVANSERAQKILSDKDLEITDLNARRDAELATESNRLQTEEAKAGNDKLIADAQKEARAAEAELREVELQAEAALCIELAAVGVDCALYEAAKSGSYPRITLGESSNTDLLVDVGAGG